MILGLATDFQLACARNVIGFSKLFVNGTYFMVDMIDFFVIYCSRVS